MFVLFLFCYFFIIIFYFYFFQYKNELKPVMGYNKKSRSTAFFLNSSRQEVVVLLGRKK